MGDLAALRTSLKERQVKPGALGTTEVSLCLDMSLISELEQLQEDQAQWTVNNAGLSADGSMAGPPSKPLNPLDAEVEAKQDEVRSASIIVVFRGISSVRYQEVVNQFEDPDGVQRPTWLDALVAACFLECWAQGEKSDLTWAEIKPELSFAEEDDIRTRVFNLNRRRQEIPASLRPSRGQRSPVGSQH